ncbi:DUF4097 and DUF4098 domain-containing protein YvlB [Granulicella pectinivorans]|uniref:DUF4097 and DUF4098 domain-containing protein YvlB n=1 Tax=Granulicella pectinivorans TaxID=474950 RepID=A0A1I6N1N6_9BACT|nr:DUF4097 family beta strand repeat-containing protein [Granulicella pectinivorans]SFS21824.1 DUF4097 and DUF4098 domain-containing protein YvlB [Granulicella pectinivorans]
MAGAPPPYPPPYPPPQGDWRYARKAMREQMRAQRDVTRAQWKMYRDQQKYAARGYRGGSILGPIVLITIGVVFLLIHTGNINQASLFFWYGRWWPLILLAGGAILLAEWAFERTVHPDQPTYHRGRGGVVMLLMLLCLPGLLINISRDGGNGFGLMHGFSINGDNMDEFLGDRHESDQNLDQTFPVGSTLTVNNPRGEVVITGNSEDGQIHVAVHKQVYTRSDSDASAKAQQLSPTLSNSGDAFTLSVPTVDGARVDLNIRVPVTTASTITVDRGNITANSLKTPLIVTANHGDIELNAIAAAVTAHINNKGSNFSARSITGAVSLEGNCRDVDIADVNGPVTLNGDFFGKTHFEHINGAVRFHTSRTDFQLARLDGEVDLTHGELSADQLLGPVSLSTNNYNVTLERVSGDVSVTTSNGKVDLTGAPPLGNVTIQNRNGEVNVTVPEQSSFTVQAETREGDVDTDLPLSKSDDNNISRLTGTVGSGGSLIRINTTQNDISLKKGAIAPLMPPHFALPPITPAPPTPPVEPHIARPKTPRIPAPAPKP